MHQHFSLTRMLRDFKRCDNGASAIEFAMVATIMTVFLLNVVDIASYYYNKMEITGAVRAGAQYALVNTSNATTTLITGVVEDSTSLDLVNSGSVTVDMDLCGCSDGSTFTCSSGTTCGGSTTGRIHYYTGINAAYTHTWIFYTGTTSITASAAIRTQ